ncbi:uncharacterized protein LOC111918360 [Lactuca sativa]|uniref:uncharacterized protein LOC111918360 n=1 Tax=Lactuca sativa TaxID=4236 RepID=UPI0022AF1DAA|nr:uncharacterized protein LOC111918360 [Lactuca sativa]
MKVKRVNITKLQQVSHNRKKRKINKRMSHNRSKRIINKRMSRKKKGKENPNEVDLKNLERDPAKRKQMWDYPVNLREQHIHSEVGESYFFVMVDESRDESKNEQMAIVLRCVDVEGIIRESKICGQGYDGASNMRGEWNRLQELVLEDCPYAYYVHCFAHRLQLALVAASREIIPVHQFFTNLIFTINLVCASSKRHDELQKAKATKIEQLLELGEIESGIIDDVSATYSQRGDADAAYCYLKSFEFVFILHLIKEVMGKTEILSQALQKKSQYILNAMELVSATKEGLNDFRNKGWESLLAQPHWKNIYVINVDQICLLVEKYYPEDFTEQKRIQLRYQLEIFNIDITKNPRLSGVSTIANLCKRLVETQKRETYYLFDRVVR